jgi:hypothetical protein
MGRAIPLLMGTCAQESAFTYFTQLGGGPAKGIFQCEPSTEADVWANFLAYQPELRACFLERCGRDGPDVAALEHNLVYQILMARTHYLRCDPNPLPAAKDLKGQSELWKRAYNTTMGKGEPEEYVKNYNALVKPYWPPSPTP